jgi:hypothetical protein
MSLPVRFREPARGSNSPLGHELTQTQANGEDDDDEDDGQEEDLQKVKKLLAKNPQLKAALKRHLSKEAYREPRYDPAALLRERAWCEWMGIDPNKHGLALPPDFEQRFEEQWLASREMLADTMAGPRLTKESGADKATRRRRDEARAVMAFGRRGLAELGVKIH